MVAQVSQQLPIEHQGKVKTLLAHPEHGDLLLVKVSDRLTAGDGVKSAQLEEIGKIRSQIIQIIFMHLESCFIPSHFWGGEWDDESQFSVYRALPFPIESVVRFVSWGSYASRNLKIPQGTQLNGPVTELFYKCDMSHDPYLVPGPHPSESHRVGFISHHPKTGFPMPGTDEAIFVEYPELFGEDLCKQINPLQLFHQIQTQTLVVGELVRLLLLPRFRLIDLKLEFGWHAEKGLLLIDGISPDEWRVIDEDREHYDKQIFRDQGEGGLNLLYQRYFQILAYLLEKTDT